MTDTWYLDMHLFKLPSRLISGGSHWTGPSLTRLSLGWLSWLYLVVDGRWYLFYFICSLINEASLVQTTVRKNRISLPSQHLLTSFNKLWHARLRCHMEGFWRLSCPIAATAFGGRSGGWEWRDTGRKSQANASSRSIDVEGRIVLVLESWTDMYW